MSTEEIDIRIKSYEFGKEIAQHDVAGKVLEKLRLEMDEEAWRKSYLIHIDRKAEAKKAFNAFYQGLSSALVAVASRQYQLGYAEEWNKRTAKRKS